MQLKPAYETSTFAHGGLTHEASNSYIIFQDPHFS